METWLKIIGHQLHASCLDPDAVAPGQPLSHQKEARQSPLRVKSTTPISQTIQTVSLRLRMGPDWYDPQLRKQPWRWSMCESLAIRGGLQNKGTTNSRPADFPWNACQQGSRRFYLNPEGQGDVS